MTPAFDEPVYVTRPIAPPRGALDEHMGDILRAAHFTNNGPKQRLLEQLLSEYMRSPHLSVTSSGTTALMLALRALRCSGEVITTPLTFVATVNAIRWAGCDPVFCDVEDTLCIDDSKIEALVTPRTSAILGVHAFGTPCRTGAIQAIADKHGLKVIYDAAHAFGVEVEGQPISEFGDASAFSFHATKLFHSAEGGAVASPDSDVVDRVRLLRNHGIESEKSAPAPGLNGKMSELHAALGICVLREVEQERRMRLEVERAYRAVLSRAGRIYLPPAVHGLKPSLQYFPIRVGLGHRDKLKAHLRSHNVYTRSYFDPVVGGGCGQPVALSVASEILCLPFYGQLGPMSAKKIGSLVADWMEGVH